MSDTARVAAFYDREADRYDAMMDGDANNARIRQAFQRLVMTLVPPRGTLLDFGCGTGRDTKWYADQGASVVAYDHAPRMVARLAAQYDHEVRAAASCRWRFRFTSFPGALPGRRPFDTIAANFAVLNLIADPDMLFSQFARLVAPGGAVVVSVLNPLYWRDLWHAWWWRAFVSGRRTGTMRVGGADSPTYRHYLSAMVRAAGPELVLTGRRGGRWAHFIFLVFRRVA